MTASRILALDLGTTGVRAELIDGDGRVLAAPRRPLGLQLPGPDRVEQDAREFADAAIAVLREAIAAAGDDDIAALGIVAQRGSALAWDADTGAPLAPVIGWQDRRTRARVDELRAMGAPATTQAACTKFEWLLEVPAVQQARARGTLRMGTPDAWLTWVLSGGAAFVTDPSNAGATGMHFAGTPDWTDEVLALFGQERAWHPEIVATDAVVGVSCGDLLGVEIPLAARAGDQQAACFAQGVAAPGDGKLTLGTAAMLDVCTGAEIGEAVSGSYVLPLWRRTDHGDVYCLEGSVITAGAAIEWLVRLGLLSSVEELDLVTRGADADAAVRFVPALAGLGTPWMQDEVRGRFTGLGLETGAAELVAAVLDGVAQRAADVIEALGVRGRLAVDGGLTRSSVLLQRIADVSGIELAVAADSEATARGAAALAAAAPGIEFDALPPMAVARRVEPRMSESERGQRREAWRAEMAALAGAAET